MKPSKVVRFVFLTFFWSTTAIMMMTLSACVPAKGVVPQDTQPKPLVTATTEERLDETDDPGSALMGVNVPLRIMPLGDSITEGVCDTQDNCKEPSVWMIPTSGDGIDACGWAANPYNPEAVGYRTFLRDMINTRGLDMVYVGSVTVVEGLAHEGHTGWQIQDLDYCVQNGDWLEKAQPNVILLHIGTNDASERRTPEEMAKSLQDLLEHIYVKLPDTTEVIVAQIIPARQSWMNNIIIPYNELIPGVVEKLLAENKHVSFVDMTGVIHSDSENLIPMLWSIIFDRNCNPRPLSRVIWRIIYDENFKKWLVLAR